MLKDSNTIGRYNAIYRGYVLWNKDPLYKGRIKVFVPGVYPSQFQTNSNLLPWAQPAMSSFGGGAPTDGNCLNEQVGWSSVPHAGNIKTGSQVFVFFESGDINFPVYFAISQSGNGWLSQHQNQHVFKSDNVRIRIQQNFDSEKSSSKFDSYTKNQSKLAKTTLKNSCEKHNWAYDQSGTYKNVPSRIDIQIQASNYSAINLNIHGNVNMHIDGDWITQHIGNKYEYHAGQTYIKNDGPVYVQQNGTVYKNIVGNVLQTHNGNYQQTRTGNTIIILNGSFNLSVTQDITQTFNSNYKLTVGKSFTKNITEDQIITIGNNKTTTVSRGNVIQTVVLGYKQQTIGLSYSITSQEDLNFSSKGGNISLKTQGQFQLMKNDSVTIQGFNNIGTKGNIKLISTFGNISIQCIQNKSLADFETKTVVVPWNPSFYNKMLQYFPMLNIKNSLAQGMKFQTDISDFESFLKFFKSLPDLAVYDGLPVFFPTKMILQNPNIDLPKNDLDYSWIPQFRSQPSDWRNITNKEYWKIPGKLMGNITISSWSGDINISTNSKLGCAGNINICNSQSGGTLPGYKIGTYNVKSSANNRIYPDPRDLFFDSNFEARMGGQLQLFSHGTNFAQLALKLRKSVLPTAADAALKTTGFSFDWFATNYDGFYKFYSQNVVMKGSLTNTALLTSPVISMQIKNLMEKNGPQLGCTKCITDYVLGLPGIQDICYAVQNQQNFGIDGIHKFGFSKFSPIFKDCPRGTFNIQANDFNKISIGDGHAIQIGFTTSDLTGPNFGSINIDNSGDFNHTVGRNYIFTANATLNEENKTNISYICTESTIDDVYPPIIQKQFDFLNKKIQSAVEKIISIQDQIFKNKNTKKLSKDDIPLPQNELQSLGYTNNISKTTGSYSQSISSGSKAIVNYGFDLSKCLDLIVDPIKFSTLKMSFGSSTESSSNSNSSQNTSKSKSDTSILTIDLKDSSVQLDQNSSYLNSVSYLNNENYVSGNNQFKLNLNPSMPLSFPEYYWKDNNTHVTVDGNGYTKTTVFNLYELHKLKDFDVVKSVEEPIESYVDYSVIENTSVYNGSRKQAKPGKISIVKNFEAGQEIKQNINWTSPINQHVFSMNSDSYLEDEQNEKIISTNNYKILLNGNTQQPLITDKSYNYTRQKYNLYEINNNTFDHNYIKFTNDSLYKTSENSFIISNGNNEKNIETNNSINNVLIVNGNNMNNSKNNINFINGLSSTISENIFLINNGDSDYNVKNDQTQQNSVIINCGNETNAYILQNKFYFEDDIKVDSKNIQYSAGQKIINIQNNKIENVGKLHQINSTKFVQNSSELSQTNAPKIQHNAVDVQKPIISKILSLYSNIKQYIKDLFKNK